MPWGGVGCEEWVTGPVEICCVVDGVGGLLSEADIRGLSLGGGVGAEAGRFEDVSSPQEKFTVREGQTMNWLKESWACIPNVAQVETAV